MEQLDRIEQKLDEMIVLVSPKRPASVPGDRPVISAEVRVVYEYWLAVMGKNPKRTKLTPERRRTIQARLRDGYPLDDMLSAIDGCFSSDFHMARGEYRGRTKYNDLTLILRNGSNLEGFRDRKPQDTTGAFL